MHKFGTILVVVGGLLTAIGLLGGFGFMFAGSDDIAKPLLATVPLGFVVGFAGLVTTLLCPVGGDQSR